MAETDFASSIQGGIKTGDQWAQSASLNQYRMQVVSRQYAQIQAQKAKAQAQILERNHQWATAIAGEKDMTLRANIIKMYEAENADMGIDVSKTAQLLKSPEFAIDYAKSISGMLNGIDKRDPQQMSQAYASFQATNADPLLARNLVQQYASNSGKIQAAQLSAANSQQRQMNAQSFKKDTTDQSMQQKYQTALQNDPNYRKAVGTVTQANTAIQVIEAASSTPEMKQAAGITLARLATGNQRLNQVEIQGLGTGAQDISDRLTQFAKNAYSGTLTEANIDGMKKYIQVLNQGAQEDIDALSYNHAKQYAQLTKKPIDQAYQDVTGFPMPEKFSATKAPKAPADDSSSAPPPSPIKLKVDELRKNKMADTQIRSHLEGALGRPLNPDEVNQYGFGQSQAPAAAPSSAAPASPAQDDSDEEENQ